MLFAYYHRLNRQQQRVYRCSDNIRLIQLPALWRTAPLPQNLERVLKLEDRSEVEIVCKQIFNGLARALKVPAAKVTVYAVRPSGRWGELHGLYTPGNGGKPAHVEIWMRTARRRQVVAFRTFLRTLLHELCHHLDYALFKLPESFHTEGFYQRETGLLNQLVPKDASGISSPAAGQKQQV